MLRTGATSDPNRTVRGDAGTLSALWRTKRSAANRADTAEPILLVDSYVLNPQSNLDDVQRAGNELDKALAQQAGVQRMWIVVPDDAPPMEGEKLIRVHERRVYHPITNQHSLVHCELKQQATSFLN